MAFGVSAMAKEKRAKIDLSFLKRSYVGLNVAVEGEGLRHECIDGMLPSFHAVCCAVNVKPKACGTRCPSNPHLYTPCPT